MTTTPDPLSFEGAAARIGKILQAIAVIGTGGALVLGGWKTGVGFLLGAAHLRAEFSLAAQAGKRAGRG